jgi:hypothetical protein
VPPSINIEFKNTFKPGFLLVFLALLIATFTDQLLNKQIESLIQTPDGISSSIWFWGALSLFSSLLFPLLSSLLCAHTLANFETTPFHFVGSKYELGLIETLRAWGQSFLWGFVFIIPGLIYFTYYIIVPFVVMFSKKYAAGEVDALVYSKKLSKKFWYRLNWWIFVFYMVLPMGISSVLDEYLIFKTHPVTAFLIVLLETFIYFAFHFVILRLFMRYLNEFESDPDETIALGDLTTITETNEASHVAPV